MNMSVTQILYMYVTNLIIMAFIIIIMKHQNMLKSIMEACKHKWEFRNRYKNKEGTSLYLQTKVVFPPNSLESDASKIVTI